MMTTSQRVQYLLALRMYFENRDLWVLLNTLSALGARGNQHAEQRVKRIINIEVRHRRDGTYPNRIKRLAMKGVSNE